MTPETICRNCPTRRVIDEAGVLMCARITRWCCGDEQMPDARAFAEALARARPQDCPDGHWPAGLAPLRLAILDAPLTRPAAEREAAIDRLVSRCLGGRGGAAACRHHAGPWGCAAHRTRNVTTLTRAGGPCADGSCGRYEPAG